MTRIVLLLALVAVVLLAGLSLVNPPAPPVRANTTLAVANPDLSGYARATDPAYEWQFPRDHGPHPDFLTEWWYYTGNLTTADGRRFGTQFTVFRRAIAPSDAADPESVWRTRQVYMAHFTVSDIDGGRFFHQQRFARGAAGLAGATGAPRYSVWLEDWRVDALNDDATQVRIAAAMDADADNGLQAAIDLVLTQAKPPVLQGQGGLSAKSAEPGNASYYYSLPRLATTGTITVDGASFEVSGVMWMDQEFSTSALGTGATGWDWFGLIFEDGTEMMIGQIRLADGGREPAFGGMFVRADGSGTYLPSHSFTISATDTWTSPHTRATYPSGWTITVDGATLGRPTDLTFTVTPLLRDQELHTTPSYWEGAVRVEGDVTGVGYAELTGYVESMDGYF